MIAAGLTPISTIAGIPHHPPATAARRERNLRVPKGLLAPPSHVRKGAGG